MSLHRRQLSSSAFAGDDGRADAGARAALGAAGEGGAAPYLRAVAALCGVRLLVPVVAGATRFGTSGPGPASDKEAEMAVVLLESDSGRALLAFTGLDALQAWSPAARPVPVTLDQVAQTALAEQAGAVLVDAAGPHRLVIDGEVLAGLARGHRLVELDDEGFGWAVVTAQ